MSYRTNIEFETTISGIPYWVNANVDSDIGITDYTILFDGSEIDLPVSKRILIEREISDQYDEYCTEMGFDHINEIL